MRRTTLRLTGIAAFVALLSAVGVGIYVLAGSTKQGADGDPVISFEHSQPLHADPQYRRSTLDAVADAWNAEASDKRQSVEADAASFDSVDVAGRRVASEKKQELSLEPEVAHETPQAVPLAPASATDVGPSEINSGDGMASNSDRMGSRYSSQAVLATTSEGEGAIARGQEPLDADISSTQRIENPFDTTLEEPTSAEKARAAFGDQTSDPRYGSYTHPSQTTAPQPPTDQTLPAATYAAEPPSPVPLPGAAARPIGSAVQAIETNGAAYQSNSVQQDPYGYQTLPSAGVKGEPGENPFPGNAGFDPHFGASEIENTFMEQDDPALGAGVPGESALEGPQNPAVVIEKSAPQEIQVGKLAIFQIRVRNVGNRTAESVLVHDEIPKGTRLVSTSPPAESRGGVLEWELGTMSPGEQRDLEVELIPTGEGEIGSVATVTIAAQASVRTRCTLPQLALRLTAPSKVMIGDEQRVKIELHNPGSGDATGVMLFENVPQELRHAAGPALEFEVGTLRAGETREMELLLTAERAGTVVNRISARGDGNLQVEQEISFEVISPALQVGVKGPRVRYLERPAKYTLLVGNPGTAPAKDIELVSKLPKGMRFVEANNLGEYDSETHAVYWSLAELPENESGSVELVALPVEAGDHEIKVEGRAHQGLEDETSHAVRVEGLAAIMFEVVDLKDPIEVGGETTYEIRIVNQGTKAASRVEVRAQLPAGLQLISAAGETRHAAQESAVYFEPLSRLAPKADAMYKLQVRGVSPGDQRLKVEVDTEDIQQPIRKEVSTQVFDDE